MKMIYMDNASTMKAYDEVISEMERAHVNGYGNPSSHHILGERARKILDASRNNLAREINARPGEIIFTSGATESNNFVLRALSENSKKKRILISSIEHSSIYETSKFLKTKGFDVVEIPVDSYGLLDYAFLEKYLGRYYSDILLVSVVHVNNVIGVIQDLSRIGKICRKYGVLFHTDCSQSYGKERIDVRGNNISFLSCSAHKIGGPKGVGFLFVDEKQKLSPFLFGGHQEKNLRSGTENVPGIAGFSKALEIHRKVDWKKVEELRDYIIEGVVKLGGEVNGSLEKRIFNNIHASFPRFDSEFLVLALSQKGICVSSASACDSNDTGDDRVLRALGKSNSRRGSLRITLSEFNTKIEANYLLGVLKRLVEKGKGI